MCKAKKLTHQKPHYHEIFNIYGKLHFDGNTDYNTYYNKYSLNDTENIHKK